MYDHGFSDMFIVLKSYRCMIVGGQFQTTITQYYTLYSKTVSYIRISVLNSTQKLIFKISIFLYQGKTFIRGTLPLKKKYSQTNCSIQKKVEIFNFLLSSYNFNSIQFSTLVNILYMTRDILISLLKGP